jgi:hypothetical protein
LTRRGTSPLRDAAITEREIFVAALNQPGPGERRAFLDQACAGNADVRARVEALLAAHDELGSFLEGPAPPPTGALEPTADQSPAPEEEGGSLIGPYKLLEVIGEGGMGTVWARTILPRSVPYTRSPGHT